MQVCTKHWARFRELIEERGMTHLVAASGEEALQNQVNDLNASPEDKKSFDPLMNANWMVCSQALEMGGLYLMTGPYCPICEVVKNLSGSPMEGETEPIGEERLEKQWTVDVIDAVHSFAVELGHIKLQ